ncbi:MAG: protein kinase domain-containing protein [Planctomycetota bacterium]
MADDRILALAQQNGYLTDSRIGEAEVAAAHACEQGLSVRPRDLLVEWGDLSQEQLGRLAAQRSDDASDQPTPPGFRIHGRLGEGGMGDVYLAECLRDGRDVALKVLPRRLQANQEYRARFQREARALGRCEHPHVIGFEAAGTVEGLPWLAMEAVRGNDLKRHLLERGALDEAAARCLLRQIAAALTHVWQRGIVHRDVKPSNILLAPARPRQREQFCAKLIDFGLAKFREEFAPTGIHDLTGTGIAVGTPHYMSPEAASGDRSADPRHDIYSLGATVYHALLGKPLYNGRSSAVIMYKQATSRLDITPLERMGLSPAFLDLLRGMLAKPREGRIASWEAVSAHVAGLPPLPGAGLSGRLRRGPPGLRPMRLAILGAALLLIAAGVVLSLLGESEAGGVVRVGPDVLAAEIAAAVERVDGAPGGETVLLLEPGRYSGNFHIALERGLLNLRAAEGAVELVAADTNRPALCCAGGSTGRLRLVNIAVRGGLELRSGHCALVGGSVAGPEAALHVAGGELTVTRSRIDGGSTALALAPGSRARLDHVRLTGAGPVVRARDARLELHRCRLLAAASATAAVLDMDGGELIVEQTILAGNRTDAGCALRALDWGELRHVRVEGVTTGIVAHDSILGLIEAVAIEASETGIAWHGAQLTEHSWRELQIRAPQALSGMEVSGWQGAGPDPQRLTDIP